MSSISNSYFFDEDDDYLVRRAEPETHKDRIQALIERLSSEACELHGVPDDLRPKVRPYVERTLKKRLKRNPDLGSDLVKLQVVSLKLTGIRLVRLYLQIELCKVATDKLDSFAAKGSVEKQITSGLLAQAMRERLIAAGLTTASVDALEESQFEAARQLADDFDLSFDAALQRLKRAIRRVRPVFDGRTA